MLDLIAPPPGRPSMPRLSMRRLSMGRLSMRRLSMGRLSLAFATLLALGACAPQTGGGNPGPVNDEIAARYGELVDGDRVIPAVARGFLTEQTRRRDVDYVGPDGPGTIVVDPYARVLYYVLGDGRATRYGIAVGRAGLAFSGTATISRKQQWPSWTPTANMVRTQPETYAQYAGGLPGGLDNPLGARALYLYRGGRDTYYRIHGTIDVSSIGRATSAGCIRLYNHDIIELYNKIPLGAPVRVRSLEESVALEGAMTDTELGFAVPLAQDVETIRREKNRS